MKCQWKVNGESMERQWSVNGQSIAVNGKSTKSQLKVICGGLCRLGGCNGMIKQHILKYNHCCYSRLREFHWVRFSVYANTVAHHQLYPNLQLIAYDAWHMLKTLVSLHWCVCKNAMLRLYAYNPPTPCRTQVCETVRALSYRLLSSLLTQLAVSRPLTVRCPSQSLVAKHGPRRARYQPDDW